MFSPSPHGFSIGSSSYRTFLVFSLYDFRLFRYFNRGTIQISRRLHSPTALLWSDTRSWQLALLDPLYPRHRCRLTRQDGFLFFFLDGNVRSLWFFHTDAKIVVSSRVRIAIAAAAVLCVYFRRKLYGSPIRCHRQSPRRLRYHPCRFRCSLSCRVTCHVSARS